MIFDFDCGENDTFCSDYGSSTGGDYGGGRIGAPAPRRDSSPQRKLDLDGLTPFEKNFYTESSSVASMTDEDVENYRKAREITVEGRDVPKPVKSSSDVGFPGFGVFNLFVTFILDFKNQ